MKKRLEKGFIIIWTIYYVDNVSIMAPLSFTFHIEAEKKSTTHKNNIHFVVASIHSK